MVTSSNFNTTTTTSSTSSEHSSVDPEASNGHSDPPEQDHQNATTYAEEEQEEDSSASFPGWTQSSLFLKSILDALSFEAAIPCSTAAAASPPPPAPEQLDQVPASSDQSKEGPAMVSSSSSSFSKNVSTTSTTYPDPDSKDASYNSTLQIRTTPKNAHPTSSSIEEGEEEYKDYEQPMKGNKQVPNNNNNNNNNNERSSYCCPIWTRLTENGLHRWIRYTVVAAGTTAARYPKTCVMFVTILSFLLAGIGLLTNFTIKFDHRDLFTPIGSLPAKHGHWVEKESGFEDSRSMMLIVHGEDEHKNNLLQVESMERLFQVVDTVRNVPGYKEACELSEYVDPYTKENTCWIWGPTQFWEHNTTLFQQNKPTETELIQILSQNNFPSGIPVFHELMFGEHEWTNQTLVLDTNNHTNEQRQDTTTTTTTTVLSGEFISYIPAFIVSIGFPATDATEEFQERALIELQNLRNSWIDEDLQQNPNRFQLDFFCQLAYSLEYQRALTGDMPLVPIIFMVMLIFTMLVFHMYGQHQQLQLDDDDEEGENDENVTSTKTKIFQSRASIGLASVVTIGCSLMSGFGILFIAGVPFTNITLMAPFIILGVGLDDTFIITGAYFRRLRQYHRECDAQYASEQLQQQNQPKSREIIPTTPLTVDSTQSLEAEEDDEEHERIVQRVHDTLQDVGLSISLTTMTTTFAFILGCISTIPGIRWLCIYAGVTIVFDFLYQVTYFIALLTLDERRATKALHGDNAEKGQKQSWWQWCCCCFECCCGGGRQGKSISQSNPPQEQRPEQYMESQRNPLTNDEEKEFVIDRIMRWYSYQLLRPTVRVVVLVVFLGIFGLNVWSTSQLTQEFNVEDYVPDDSYVKPFLSALEEYSPLKVPMAVYFRYVNQSDPLIQKQMIDYIDEISALPQIGRPPEYCWVRDMYSLLNAGEDAAGQVQNSAMLSGATDSQKEQLALMSEALQNGDYTFEEKMQIVLSIPGVQDVYGEDIVQDPETLEITASRCHIFLRHLELNDIKEQIEMLHDQHKITSEQPINQGKDDFPFFSFDDLFYYWQLYTVAVDELIVTTITGVVAVCIIGFIIIPHWTAVVFVGPMIIMVYFNLLGTMQFCGMHINAVTYVTIVIAIGLLVDFLMHILLRYYETEGTTREAKVKETLETMGASMMLGGFTTWVGVIPMAFSSTKIFMTLFVAFLAMVSWGLLVGLVFLPVVLSYCGPIVCTTIAGKSEKKPFNTNISSHSPTKASPVPSSNTSKCDSKDFLHLQQEEETGFYTVPGAKSMPSSAIEGSTQHTTSSRQAGRTICSGEIRSDDEIHAVPSDQAGTATVQPMPDPYDDDDNARAEEGGMFSGCFPHIVG